MKENYEKQATNLQEQNDVLEEGMSLRDRVEAIFKKYGFTAFAVLSAVGVTFGVILSNLKSGLSTSGKGVGNGLKAIGKKLGEILPGLIGAIASFIFKTAGEVISFLGKNAWLLVVAVVVYAVEQFKSKNKKKKIYMDEYNRVYPPEDQPQNFRLQHATNYLSDMEKELGSREETFQKCKKLFKNLIKISASLGTLSVILSGSGTGTALTGVGLPVGASLAALAAICGILSVSAGVSLKKVYVKVAKHEKIVTLC